MKTYTYLEIIRRENKEVERRIDVSERSDRYIERCERGILINLNSDKFYVETAFYAQPQPVK